MTSDLTRRRALTGAATVGVGVPLLVSCGGGEKSAATDPGAPAGAPGDVLAATPDIEVGGGAIFPDEKVVVTQPSDGEFRAFSATCTHQGCLVTSVSEGTIRCPCHGSEFSVEDGSVQSGPARAPLPEVEIVVEGGRITLA